MTELTKEGWAVTLNPGTGNWDRKPVAVFTSELNARAYIAYAYPKDDPRKPEIEHVWFGTEPY